MMITDRLEQTNCASFFMEADDTTTDNRSERNWLRDARRLGDGHGLPHHR